MNSKKAKLYRKALRKMVDIGMVSQEQTQYDRVGMTNTVVIGDGCARGTYKLMKKHGAKKVLENNGVADQ